jgi:hypothetical protein
MNSVLKSLALLLIFGASQAFAFYQMDSAVQTVGTLQIAASEITNPTGEPGSGAQAVNAVLMGGTAQVDPSGREVDGILNQVLNLLRISSIGFTLIYGVFLGLSFSFGQVDLNNIVSYFVGAIFVLGASLIASLFALSLFTSGSA